MTICILLVLSHMGDSRFQFSTKFQFTECWRHLPNIHERIDFSFVKSTNLPSKSGKNSFWEDGWKFFNFEFHKNWSQMTKMDGRNHLSTLQIVYWNINLKIFFKHIRALCEWMIMLQSFHKLELFFGFKLWKNYARISKRLRLTSMSCISFYIKGRLHCHNH